MPVVMRLCGDAFGRPTPGDGKFLASFDFEAHDGQGEIVMTKHLANAKRFETMAEAWEFWRTSPKCRPLREDGKPNRPLTATNWSFETVIRKGGPRHVGP